MALEVARLLQSELLTTEKIFSMLGHKDGVIAFSDNMEKAVLLIVEYYAKAIALEQNM